MWTVLNNVALSFVLSIVYAWALNTVDVASASDLIRVVQMIVRDSRRQKERPAGT